MIIKANSDGFKIVIIMVLMFGLWLSFGLASTLAQQDSNLQNLIVNGGFEEGFQGEFGVGYGWGGFSNGNAVVGWSADSWDKVVAAGQYAQLIEIKNATDRDRYAGIYQTVPVVAGQQYRLTIKGLIRSEEGSIEVSDFGYRLQYGIDYNGGASWELMKDADWVEIPWDEQPLAEPPDGAYRLDVFETTITARSDQLTLFIRGWKKWLNDGSGIYNLDEINLVGPAPEILQAPEAQAVSVGETTQQAPTELVAPDASIQVSEHDGDMVSDPAQPDSPSQEDRPAEVSPPSQSETSPQDDSAETNTPSQVEPPQTDGSAETNTPSQTEAQPQISPSPQTDAAQLPVSGRGSEDSTDYITIVGLILVLILLIGAMTAARRRRSLVE